MSKTEKVSRLKRKLNILFKPFCVINENQFDFTIWFLFTIVAGQLGVICNIIVKYYANDVGIKYSVAMETLNGSFYTFSIALVASLLGPIFTNFLYSKNIDFRTQKIVAIIFSIFYLFITGTIYASIQSGATIRVNEGDNFQIDWTQLFTYLLANILVIWGYCVMKLDTNSKRYDDINEPNFSQIDDRNVEERIEAATVITQDSNGIKL